MNKNKITMCVMGGIGLLVVLVFAYLTYSASTDKAEKLEDLEAAVSRVQSASKAKIAPDKSSIEAIETNRVELLSWKEHALEEAASGDKYIDLNITPSAFRQNMTQQYMKEEASKPGGVDGKIAKDDFCFGFDSLKNSNPEENELPILLRQWEDIKFFVDTLSECGAVEIVSVSKGSAKPVAVQEEPPKRGGKNKKDEPPKPLADTQSYTIVFTARQVALVKAINAFSTSERFTIIDDYSFSRTRDTIAEALGEKDKDSSGAQAQGGRRRRGRRAAEEAEAADQEGADVAKKGLVVDPANDAPFLVTMKLTTYDFGTRAKNAEAQAEATEEVEQ